MDVQILLWDSVFSSLRMGGYPEVHLLDQVVIRFLIFWGTTIFLHSHQQCTGVPVSQYPHQYLLFSVVFSFLIVVFFINMRWYFLVVLIGISKIISDVERLFMCFLAICKSSLGKCLFKSFAYLWIGSLSFFVILQFFYIFWILLFYQIYSLQVFSPILWVVFLFCQCLELWTCFQLDCCVFFPLKVFKNLIDILGSSSCCLKW